MILLAPRIETFAGIEPDFGYEWEPDAVGWARFNRHVRHFLVEKAGFAPEDLRKWTFKQLCDAFEPYVRERDEVLNDHRRDTLDDLQKVGLQHLDYWRSRVRQRIASLQTYIECKGEPAKWPFLHVNEIIWSHDFRILTPSELSDIYFIMGLKIEETFCLQDIFVPADIRTHLGNFLSEQYESRWQAVELKYDMTRHPRGDFGIWADLIKQDLAGLKSQEEPTEDNGGKAKGRTRKKRQRPPLPNNDIAVLELLENLPERKGLTGKQIFQALDEKEIYIDESTLTKSIIPRLRRNGYNIKNNRDGAGYYIKS